MHQRLFASILGVAFLGSSAVVVGGCSLQTAPEPSLESPAVQESSVVDPALFAELEAKINRYAQSLLENDMGYVDALVSSEVKLRARQMSSDVRGFAVKMGKSLRAELEQRGIDANADITGLLKVDDVAEEGAALRVEVSIDGVEIGKPFYFVYEDGEYKLNVKRPGFTRPLPAGAEASRDTCLVRSLRGANTSFKCAGTATFNVPKARRCEDVGGCGSPDYCDNSISPPQCYVASVTTPKCDSTCGWWTGSTFTQASTSKKCDYNTFGTDVYVNSNDTWNCNDAC